MFKNKTFKLVCGVSFILFAISFVVWAVFRLSLAVGFDNNCAQHIKRAAKAVTVEEARESLKVAVAYIEQEGLTEGYTSIFYRSKDENVKLWYSKVKGSLRGLEKITSGTTRDGELKMLIQLKKALFKSSPIGDVVILPPGISAYPHNIFLFCWGMISFIICVVCIMILDRIVVIRDDEISGGFV
ncbi:MAG: hypothetical protein WC349_00335 [Patescibacteria group bacterium]|jgi:hypothetical protein